MKAHELRDLTLTELEARLKDERDALQNLRFTKSVTGQLENPARLRNHRREVARLVTIIKEKSSAE
ncbi:MULTISPECIES: 50S ribosomal protein L29 [Gracilimonas]|jgi:large subunit ribosomal protein L29|uniref:Large ribosomal subunit protein uL29 n=1 Tax=Gracilimonas halophila TaxID=1834464 RepID=A0ABW5JJW8_9BACT|nr:50S ribosomal protein L29 [Gracilimonas sp.]